jgi:hypothetical protein
MGNLTEIVILNDALHEFRTDPKMFGEAVLNGIDKANMVNGQVSVGFNGYCNYINVEPSRHADHEVLFLHAGNRLTAIGAYEKDWVNIVERNTEFAKKCITSAKYIIKMAEKKLKVCAAEKKEKNNS